MKFTQLPPLPTTSDILKLYKLRASKHLSQNFILDINLLRKFVRYGRRNLNNYHCIEVGPGPGGITSQLLSHGAKSVSVIEKDYRFMSNLQLLADASDHRLNIYQNDCLQTDFGEIAQNVLSRYGEGKFIIYGNLPFNVATPLLIKFLRNIYEKTNIWAIDIDTELILSFQKELVDRMFAKENSFDRSRFTVMCQSIADIEELFVMKNTCFVPKPKVDASVVRIRRLANPLQLSVSLSQFEKVVTKSFIHKNKSISYIIKKHFVSGDGIQKKIIEECSDVIDMERKVTSLTVEEFDRFAVKLVELNERFPECDLLK
ncbi:hypothetical protein SNEBB_008400 [Seison nebaliae]|nr:hypothetical protein SNEBB_008400 [Seison nebaliae]